MEVRVIRALDLSRVAGAYLAPAPSAFVAARRELEEFAPEVLHANTLHYTGCLAAARTARRTGIPLVTTMQLGPVEHLPLLTRWCAGRYDGTFGRYILRRSERVLAVSEAVRRHAIALGADPSTIELAPNGVDHQRFRLEARAPAEEPHVVTVGRLLANKGPQLLIEAATAVRAAGHRFHLTFVGDGPLRRKLEARTRDLGMARTISFVGHVADPEGWYAGADIVVRPSFTEGLALAVLEAMAAGRCNIVSDIPANVELIRDGVNGLTFRCGDVTDLARVLAAALEDREGRAVLGRQAEQDSLQYSWDRMASLTAAAMVAVAR